MPKLLVMCSLKNKKDRKVETSLPRMKEMVKARVDKDPEDTDYVVLTLNTKWTLDMVRTLVNTPFKKLKKMKEISEGITKLTVNPESKRVKVSTGKGE